ncbi:MAG: hypothetical protein ACFFG0_31215 [Candidatus Thorarchaeota archaeon]
MIKRIQKSLTNSIRSLQTTWENKNSKKTNDYRPHLRKAGFKINKYSETPDWERRQREVNQKILELKDMLKKDMGWNGAFTWISEAQTYLPILNKMRFILTLRLRSNKLEFIECKGDINE